MVNNVIQLNGLDFELFISDQEIQDIIHGLAQKINQDYDLKNPLFIVMLNGAFIFAADLLRQVSIPSDITMARTKSYQGTRSTGVVQLLLEPDIAIENRHILIIEVRDYSSTVKYLNVY